MFSKTCEYGIRAVVYVALMSLEGGRVRLKEIAHEIGSPEAFTAKILQQLAKNNIINSVKGPLGGFEVSPKIMKTVTLRDIVLAFDGDKVFNECGLGLRKCNEKKPCPLHNKFKVIRNDLKEMLTTTTIFNLTQGLSEKETWLKV